VHKEVDKVVFDGSEDWDINSYENTYYYRLTSIVIPAQTSGYSNYFAIVPSSAGIISQRNAIRVQNNQVDLIKDGSNVSLANFKTWLGSHNTSVYYVLVTPTDTKITNSTLIGQLNALYTMLPEGVADVVVTGDLAGSLTIKYYQQGTGTYTAPIVGGAEIDGGDNEQVVELDSYLPYRLVYDTNGYWRVLNKGPKVTTGAIADGSITTAKLDDGAVATNKLANGSVSNSKIANGAVNVAKIEDGAVSTAKLANGAVTSGKIDWTTINYGSTTEDVIIGVYNGSPVYRHAEEFTISSSGWVPTNLARPIANFGKLINVFGSVHQTGSGNDNWFPVFRVRPTNATYGFGVATVSSTTITFDIGTDVNGRKDIIVFIDYTKTTD
jgi:hypothetical protein